MKRTSILTLAAFGALAVSAALAQPMQGPPMPGHMPSKCFFINQFQNWKAPDDRTMFIRVNVNDYYRIDLASACPALKMPMAHLITITRGPDTVCSGVDWDLQVAQDPPGSIPEPCIVRAQTPMAPADVAAIPPQYKP